MNCGRLRRKVKLQPKKNPTQQQQTHDDDLHVTTHRGFFTHITFDVNGQNEPTRQVYYKVNSGDFTPLKFGS
jgi:hypothetical protein